MKRLLHIVPFVLLLCCACSTPRRVHTDVTEVHTRDTVTVMQRDTVRLTVESSGGQTEREEIVYRTVTVYDTLGRVRTVVQEDKASRLVANYYRSLYDSLRFEMIKLEARHKADSLQHRHDDEPVVKVETWRDRLGNALACIFGMMLLILVGALFIGRMLKKER